MQIFKDNKGREWVVEITVSTINRIKDLTGVNILETDAIKTLGGDILQLVNVLYAIVQPQAMKDGITDEQFGEALGGDSIDAASEAFMTEYVGFFPRRKRSLLQTALDKQREIEGRAMDAIKAKLDKAVELQLEQLLAD